MLRYNSNCCCWTVKTLVLDHSEYLEASWKQTAALEEKEEGIVCSDPVLGLEQSCVWGARLTLIQQGGSVCCMTRPVWPAARSPPCSYVCLSV